MGQLAKPFVLSEAALATLDQLVCRDAARKLIRARALPFSHQGQHCQQISNRWILVWPRSSTCVNAISKSVCKEPLVRKPDATNPESDPQVEAHITQIACSEAPDGRTRWIVSRFDQS